MPFYQYVCDQCDAEIEEYRLMSDADRVELCSVCDKGKLVRSFSGAINLSKAQKKTQKVGDIVKDFIKESAKDLAREKDRLKKERD